MPTILLGTRSMYSVEVPRTRGIRMGGKVGQPEVPVIDPLSCSPYNSGEMARATNPGAPQRVSAHVVQKAPSFSSDDEEEKTTIESGGWEEEASTTVEQGEVADKVRALATLGHAARSSTNITSTNGSGVNDEPTVDDQRASAALALMPPPSAARLVITQGKDAGRHLEIRPGKTYTIGRGIDNDLVLTDITASRKHFDIRHENGAWVLADRASGNGTLINSRI